MGKSMLQFIMVQLCGADAELANNFKEASKVWSTRATDLDAVNKKYNDVNGGWAEANKMQKDVETEDGKDEFCEKTNVKLTIIRSDLDRISSQVEALKARFA